MIASSSRSTLFMLMVIVGFVRNYVLKLQLFKKCYYAQSTGYVCLCVCIWVHKQMLLKMSPCANFVFFLVIGMQKRISTIFLTDAPMQTTPTKRKLKMSQEFFSVLLIYSVYITISLCMGEKEWMRGKGESKGINISFSTKEGFGDYGKLRPSPCL